jgi:hypothetical protein
MKPDKSSQIAWKRLSETCPIGKWYILCAFAVMAIHNPVSNAIIGLRIRPMYNLYKDKDTPIFLNVP